MIINLTPHPIVVLDADGKTVRMTLPSAGIVRLAVKKTPVGEVDGVEVIETSFGKPEGLPEVVSGTTYVVSQLVRAACPDRQDLVFPGDVVRDDKGGIVGCKNFSR